MAHLFSDVDPGFLIGKGGFNTLLRTPRTVTTVRFIDFRDEGNCLPGYKV